MRCRAEGEHHHHGDRADGQRRPAPADARAAGADLLRGAAHLPAQAAVGAEDAGGEQGGEDPVGGSHRRRPCVFRSSLATVLAMAWRCFSAAAAFLACSRAAARSTVVTTAPQREHVRSTRFPFRFPRPSWWSPPRQTPARAPLICFACVIRASTFLA